MSYRFQFSKPKWKVFFVVLWKEKKQKSNRLVSQTSFLLFHYIFHWTLHILVDFWNENSSIENIFHQLNKKFINEHFHNTKPWKKVLRAVKTWNWQLKLPLAIGTQENRQTTMLKQFNQLVTDISVSILLHLVFYKIYNTFKVIMSAFTLKCQNFSGRLLNLLKFLQTNKCCSLLCFFLVAILHLERSISRLEPICKVRFPISATSLENNKTFSGKIPKQCQIVPNFGFPDLFVYSENWGKKLQKHQLATYEKNQITICDWNYLKNCDSFFQKNSGKLNGMLIGKFYWE